MYSVGWICYNCFSYFALLFEFFETMDKQKFKELMDELRQLREETRQSRQEERKSQEELEKKLADLQKEVTATQEKASKELAQKITKSSYQFQRKGHERQFNFNSGVQESIAAAQSELAKVTPASDTERETLKKVTASLDEGAKPLATRQNIFNWRIARNMAGSWLNTTKMILWRLIWMMRSA